jgi:membrane protein
VLSLFTSFPLFQEFSDALQTFLIKNLLPADISDTIMQHLHEFATQASKLTAIGSSFLIVTSVLLVMSIDSGLNQIWHVSRPRTLAHRVVVYWGVISLGPIIVGASLWISAYLAKKSMGFLGDIPNFFGLSLSFLPFALTCIGFAFLFMLVPHRHVGFKDASIGGAVTAIILEAVKLGLTYYVTQFPTYKMIYGAFSTLPVFLVWLYSSWLAVLIGALIAANLPVIRTGRFESESAAGSAFIEALAVLETLAGSRQMQPPGASTETLMNGVKVRYETLIDILHTLEDLDLITRIDGKGGERWVLICDTVTAKLSPLFDRLAIDRSALAMDLRPELRSAISQLISLSGDPTLADVRLRHDKSVIEPLQSAD